VPRHAQAAAEIRYEALRAGVGDAGGHVPSGDAWRWDDRPGVLNGYYATADIAIVCGSLGPYAGHNPMEPAACGCAVVTGRRHRSQQQSVALLQRHGAIDVVRDGRDLELVLQRLTADEAWRTTRGQRALAAVREARGGAKRAVARLASWDLWPAA